MQRLPGIDIAVLAIYLAAVVGLGAWFAQRNRTSAHFMAASGTLPGWAVGLSIFGTYLSSNTFIGVPDKFIKPVASGEKLLLAVTQVPFADLGRLIAILL